MSQQTPLHDQLRDRLISGEFEPGQRLRPSVLRHDYGVSASHMRELLFRLSTVQLVDFQEQRGFRLPLQSPERVHDLTVFRVMLESEGACRSIRHGDIAWEARLIAAHHGLSHIEAQVGRGKDDPALLKLWTAAEQSFHRTLIEACGLEVLKQTHAQVYNQFRQQMITTDRKFVYIPENIAQHQGILDAVLQRDGALTRTRIAEHLSRNLMPEKQP